MTSIFNQRLDRIILDIHICLNDPSIPKQFNNNSKYNNNKYRIYIAPFS